MTPSSGMRHYGTTSSAEEDVELQVPTEKEGVSEFRGLFFSQLARGGVFMGLLVLLGLSGVLLVVTGGRAGVLEWSSSTDDAFSSPNSLTNADEASVLWRMAEARTTSSSDDLSFTLVRVGYDAIDLFSESPSDILKYDHLSDYWGILEPGQTMHLEVYNDADSSTNKFRYTVCEPDGDECQHGVKYDPDPGLAATVNFQCEPWDEYVINVTEFDGDSSTELRSVTGLVLCQYVRREIRTLSVQDLSSTLDAMHTLWAVEDEEGQELYGDDYQSASYLLKSHHFNAAWPDGDHIHEGNGFMTQHVKMTNIFEKSMQAVDPTVSLPYWDFTMDNVEGKTPYTSTLFTETVFGSMSLPRDISWGFTSEDDKIIDGAIPDGRWAYITADKNKDYDDLLYGYGYMRAPWNMNPSPYVSRFAYDYQIGISLPSCKTHYDILQYDSMMDFFVDVEDSPHATTHSLTGGIYGCDLMKPMLEAGYITSTDAMKEICAKWVFYMKEFYRQKFLVPYDDCKVEDDVQDSTCGFTCDAETQYNLELDLQAKIGPWTGDLDDEGWSAWREFVCTGDGAKIFSGDHLESASPADPSFWVIHPTLDRLLQAKFMAGGFSDETWATDAENDYVCNKAECYEDSYSARGYYAECCYGHYENDKMLDFVSGNRSQHTGWTNGRVVKALDPRSSGEYSMNYVYDSFSWGHCSAQSSEYDFEALLKTMYNGEDEVDIADVEEEEDKEEDEEEEDVDTLPSQPTMQPTSGLPSQPTAEPSEVPTHKPTHSPDYIRPTNHPTVTGYTHRPTHHPSAKPTREPTQPPSAVPTATPSDLPTFAPTDRPSFPPTERPTDVPTEKPVEEAAEPTHKPTRHPTEEPTAKPSKSPKPTKGGDD